MKRILSILLLIAFVISSFSFENIYAATYDDYRDVNWMDECKLPFAYKPTSGFKITSPSGDSRSANQGNDTDQPPEVLEVRLGETVNITNQSKKGSGSLDRYDFQVYCRTNDGKSVIKEYSSLPTSWVMSELGTWDFYLCVRDNTTLVGGWTNWSDNGTKQAVGPSGMLWYFTHVRVNVLPQTGDITVYYRDLATNEDLYEPTEMKDINYGTYTINAKAAPTDYKLISQSPQQVKITASDPSKEVFFYYQKQVEAIEAGTIIAYYRDKVTSADIMPSSVYSGLEYGIHQIDAAPAPDKYTLETPSPQMIELSAAQPFKEVVFLYKGDGSLYNKPPVAIIDAPEWVYAGEEFHISGKRSYDSDGTISAYNWKYDNEYTGCTLSDKKEGYIWFDYENNGRIDLTATDNGGATGTDRVYVEILPPIPVAKITPTGILKENRKVNISAGNSWSPKHYPIDHIRNEWKYNIPDMKYNGSFVGRDKDVLFKQAGRKEFNLKVWNTYSDPTVPNGFSGELTDDFIIQPDLAPVADFSVPSVVLRDPSDENKATIVVSNTSKSNDSDIIGKTVMFYGYDSNNDNNFDNETWYYSLNGTTWQPVGMAYNQIKTGFDIYSRGTSNPANFELKANRTEIAKYKFEAMTIEDIPESQTIKEFLNPQDYKSADTFSTKPNTQKICDVKNVAPTIDFEIKKIIPMDLVVVTDYAQTDYDNLQAAIDVMKAQVLPLDVEPKVHIVNEKKSNAGEREVQKYYWNRYIPIAISGPAFNWNGNFSFSKTVNIGLESLEFFEGEENFPDRSKYSYTIDSWWIGDYENSSGSMKYYYINVDYSIYYNGQLERRLNREINFAQGQNFNGLGTFFQDTSKLAVSFDTTFYPKRFTKDIEPSGSEKRPFGTNNIDKIKSLAIDGDSNKYILFAVENFYNIAEIDSSLKDYLQLNNYGIYIVSDDITRKKSVLMGPWDDIYFVGGAKSYLAGNTLYRYDGNELKEVTNTGRPGKYSPTPTNSITASFHNFSVRYQYSPSRDEVRETILLDETINETIAINNGSITVQGTTLNNVKALYACSNYYFAELINGDICYFYRNIDLYTSSSTVNQYMTFSNLKKIEGAKGIKALDSISYNIPNEGGFHHTATLQAQKVYFMDKNNVLYEAESQGKFVIPYSSDNGIIWTTCSPAGGQIRKITQDIIDFWPYKETLTGTYYDESWEKKQYTYHEIKVNYIYPSELTTKIKSDLDVDMYANRDYIFLLQN